ncbi:hypothetical protein ACI2VH_02650 [Ralstonia nicotianae]
MSKTDHELVGPFPRGTNPVHPGVYMTEPSVLMPARFYQYWNGRYWGVFMPTPQSAEEQKNERSQFQTPKWWGIAMKGGSDGNP